MTRYQRRFALLPVGLVLIMLLIAGTACSLSSNDDKDKKDAGAPTVPATITPPGTRTTVPTFTPFGAGASPTRPFYSVPTSTQLAFRPTSVYTPFPTWAPGIPTATAYPYDIRITFPSYGNIVSGYITIIGSASHPNFLQYALEWGPEPNPSNLWYPVPESPARSTVVLNGALGYWNTSAVRDGMYNLRVHVWLRDGTQTWSYPYTLVQVINTRPTAVPSPTPTLRPNQNPAISPIPGQTVNAGQTIKIPVTVSDADGDTVNLFVASSNTSVATATVTGTTEVSVTGVTASGATITVTANDNHGGVVSTSFVVNVQGQNRAPTLNPISNQTVNAGQTLDLPVTAADPDGDQLTVTATSDTTAIATAAMNDKTTLRITGVATGKANITVTANDGKGGVISATFQVTVGTPNQPPTINPISPESMAENETKNVTYTASDPDGNQLTAVVSSDNENVVTASIPQPGTIALAAKSQGTASVTLTVNDNVNPPVSTIFTVSVAVGNRPPSFTTIPPQTMSSTDTLKVPFSVSDPDNDQLDVSASSDNEGVVSASVTASGEITLQAHTAGTATITARAKDAANPEVTTTFTVSVAAVNLPPTLSPIGAQTMNAGATTDLAYVATDPEGTTLTAQATSSDENVISASISTPGLIHLTANGAGTATITVTVNDGANEAVSTTFDVTVQQNQPPQVSTVDTQTVNAGESITVSISATDPEGDPVSVTTVAATDPNIATATSGDMSVIVTGVAAGSTTVSVDVSDNKNAVSTITFQVNVNSVNNSPVIQLSQDTVTLRVGEQISVPVTVSDQDNDSVAFSAVSADNNIVMAEAVGNNTVILTGQAEGSVVVNLTADDAKGGVITSSLNVSVTAAPETSTLDLMTIPVLPTISQEMAYELGLIYQGGLGLGNQARAFSKVGDDSVDSQNFMVPFATPGTYDLGNYGSLQSTIDFYAGTSVRGGDPTINSFNVDSLAAGDDFTIDTLFETVPAGTACDTIGGGQQNIACEYLLTHPSIALINFRAENVVGVMTPEAFRDSLNVLVAQNQSTYGVIPVLATIPAGSGHTTEEIAPYNQVIVDVATQAGVPLWNLWRAMKEHNITDPYTVAPEGPANFSDAALNYGYNVRNLTALQVLETVRQAAGILQ